ncbi:TIGR03086 family metal-binding protein [Amycolatopsis sp. NPDC051903]|uniref:TIGR03086 family metal-binding protein n=1 Tax=Amycolatopsis sp. NPDC051903 TaxID=3363936 RepID=UPI00379598AC
MLAYFHRSCADFDRRLRAVRPDQWTAPTPCSEWTVRALVNHVVRGNFNYAALLHGGSAADFVRLRDADALGCDAVSAFAASVRSAMAAFESPGALDRVVDYPLGRIRGAQALAVRTADVVIHTWDLARAVGGDEVLDAELVGWIGDNLDAIYAGLPETPGSVETTHRFFAEPRGMSLSGAQGRLLHRMGREASG